MKLNFDKDVLKKHHYWLVAGGALVLSVAALFMLRTGVRASILKQKTKVEKGLESLAAEAGKEVKSKASIEAKRKEAEAFKAQEVVVWKMASQKQEDLIRFPPAIESKYKFNRDPESGEIGFFLTSATINAADAAHEPVSLESNSFKGVVLETDDTKIRVKGPVKIIVSAKKDEEPKERVQDMEFTFYNTPTIKVGKDEMGMGAGKGVFADIVTGNKVTLEFERGRYFNDLLTQQERTDFKDSYREQFVEILKQVNPIMLDGTGVVQLGLGAGGAGFWPFADQAPEVSTKFIHIVDPAELNPNQDFSELAWIAQENVWIQREIYRLVDQANSYVRVFEPTKETLAKKSKSWIGQNAYWEAELKLKDANNIDVTLRNLLPRRQGLNVVLMVWFKGVTEPERVPVGGASARDAKGGPKSSHSVNVELADGVDRSEIVRVEQELTWDLAAVKRIDEVGMGADALATPHSHRTLPMGLKPFKEVKKEVKEGEVVVPGMGVASPVNPGKVGDGGIGVGVGKPGGTHRYVEVSQQARRVPVVVSLIVDQQHVDRVQTSFANSKLRFLTTQVLMNRYPFSLNPNLNKKAEGGFGEPPGTIPIGPMPIPMNPVGGFPMGGGFPMAGGSGSFGNDAGNRGNEELEANVELVLYGVVTIYERYPPKKEVTETPPTPPA